MDIFVLEMGENAVRNDVFPLQFAQDWTCLTEFSEQFPVTKGHRNYLFPQPENRLTFNYYAIWCKCFAVTRLHFFVTLIVCLLPLFSSEWPGYHVNFYSFPFKVAPQALRDLWMECFCVDQFIDAASPWLFTFDLESCHADHKILLPVINKFYR